MHIQLNLRLPIFPTRPWILQGQELSVFWKNQWADLSLPFVSFKTVGDAGSYKLMTQNEKKFHTLRWIDIYLLNTVPVYRVVPQIDINEEFEFSYQIGVILIFANFLGWLHQIKYFNCEILDYKIWFLFMLYLPSLKSQIVCVLIKTNKSFLPSLFPWKQLLSPLGDDDCDIYLLVSK